MACMTFCARFATSNTASCAWACGVWSSRRSSTSRSMRRTWCMTSPPLRLGRVLRVEREKIITERPHIPGHNIGGQVLMHDLQTTALPAGMHDDVETGPGMVQTCLQRLGLGILTPERATHLHLDTDGMRKGRIGGLSHIEGAPDLRVRLLKPERTPA